MPKKISISDDDIKAIITPELDRAKEWAEQLSDERKRCQELYDMAPLGNEMEGFSQAVASTVYEAVEWLKPGLSEIFTHPDFFTVKMQESERGDRIKDIVRHQLFTQQRGGKILRDYLDGALKFHFSALKVCYADEYDDEDVEFARVTLDEAAQLEQAGYVLSKYDEVQSVDPATMQPTVWLENVKGVHRAVKFRGPKVMAVPAWEFFISPGSRDIDTARIVAHRVPRMLHDIRAGENAGIYRKGSYKKLLDKTPKGEIGDDRAIASNEHVTLYDGDHLSVTDFADTAETSTHQSADAARRVFVWEVYTSLDIDADGLLEPVIVRMCEGEVLSVEENPYKRPPFRAGRVIEVAHRFEGKALPLVLESDQTELTNLTRLFTDSSAEAAYATAISSDQTFQKQWAERQIGDSLFVQGNPVDKVLFQRSPGPDQTVLQAIEMREGLVERKSGVSRYNQGIDANSLNKTATGISLISSAGQSRQKHIARILGETLADVLRDMVQINKMWSPYIESADLQPEQGLFDAPFNIEIEVGVGPQDRMAQSQYLLQHQQWLTGFAIPNGVAGPEHAVRTQSKIGKLQGVPFDDLMRAPDDIDSAQKAQQQIQQMSQQLQALNEQLAKLTQDNQKLKVEAQGKDPALETAKVQSDIVLRQREVDGKLALEGAKLQLEREKLAVNTRLEVAKMRQDVAAAEAALVDTPDGVPGIVPPPPPTPAPVRKRITIVRDQNGAIVGADAIEEAMQ